MIDDKFQTLIQYLEGGIKAVSRMGLKFLEARDGFVKLMIPLEDNENHINAMSAGVLFTIAEMAGGAAITVSTDFTKYFPVAKEIKIRFRKPAKSDITIEAEISQNQGKEIMKEVDEKGKTDVAIELELKDTDGIVVSSIEGIWHVRKIGSGI